MKILRRGSRGPEVERWQHFLIGQGQRLKADGDFGPATERATKRYQRLCKLGVVDGIVGNATLQRAMQDGFDALPFEDVPRSKQSAAWPPRPSNLKPISTAQRKRLLGEFSYKAAPTGRNPERIIVDPKWVRDNIVKLPVPQLSHAVRYNGRPVTTIRMHRVVVPHFEALLDDWEKQDLLVLILTWDGDYYPRFIRGSHSSLSNHSFGSAVDMNRAYNKLGHVPALVGELGSVRQLVKTANKHGFYWGGHYKHRKDGMHFEFVGKPS